MSECHPQPVYNLTIEGEPEYFANGILVHNCDAMRYAARWIDTYLAGATVDYSKYHDFKASRTSHLPPGTFDRR